MENGDEGGIESGDEGGVESGDEGGVDSGSGARDGGGSGGVARPIGRADANTDTRWSKSGVDNEAPSQSPNAASARSSSSVTAAWNKCRIGSGTTVATNAPPPAAASPEPKGSYGENTRPERVYEANQHRALRKIANSSTYVTRWHAAQNARKTVISNSFPRMKEVGKDNSSQWI